MAPLRSAVRDAEVLTPPAQASAILTTAAEQKTATETPEGGAPQGGAAWRMEVQNQNDEAVAIYTILTLVRRKNG